jgi:AAA15 family ATPase/GTPase
MKIHKIELKGYNQFKDVVIDLTYPQGHEKEGYPLDKVCIIGQSGTGKTSLLRLIKWFVSLKSSISENIELPLLPENTVSMDIQFFDLNYRMYNTGESAKLLFDWQQEIDDEAFYKLLNTYIRQVEPLLLNFPTEKVSGINRPELETVNTAVELEKIRERMKYPIKIEPQNTIDFAFDDLSRTWDHILNRIQEHRAQQLFLGKKLGEAAALENVSKKEIEKRTKEYKEWLANHPDPIKDLADRFLDSLLSPLMLKTKTGIDLETIQDLGIIQLETFDGKDVPVQFWSTGTRQLIRTTVPIYLVKPKNAVILIDEPERSLYPDIQTNIIDAYVQLAPGCQFFFATHSPIIASSFEPWEIVELKFDRSDMCVYRDLHYEGENHVNNYKYFPQYLRWDSILERIFELDEEGGKKRLKALEKLSEVEMRIRTLKKKGQLDTPKGKKLVEEFKSLSQKVDWEFD